MAVFNTSFAPVSLAPGAFATPAAISALGFGLVPFNVQDIGGKVYVTYAPSGLANQRAATGGMGAVAVFDESGNLLQTIIGSQFAAPWGVALAPAGFGEFANDLLVGNFSFVDGDQINAFDPTIGVFEGMIPVNLAPAKPRAASGRSISGSAAAMATPIPSISPTGSTARRTGCSPP